MRRQGLPGGAGRAGGPESRKGATQDDTVLSFTKLLIAIGPKDGERGGPKTIARSRLLQCIAEAKVFPNADAHRRAKTTRIALASLNEKGLVTVVGDDRLALAG